MLFRESGLTRPLTAQEKRSAHEPFDGMTVIYLPDDRGPKTQLSSGPSVPGSQHSPRTHKEVGDTLSPMAKPTEGFREPSPRGVHEHSQSKAPETIWKRTARTRGIQ